MAVFTPTCATQELAVLPFAKAGHPHHPLYLRADSPMEDFSMEEYLNVRP